MSARRARLERLRDRFVAISMRSRSLRLTRPSRSGALDLARLEGRDDRRLVWLVKVLGAADVRPGPIADVASGEGGDPFSLDVATLARAARDERMQTGAETLSVGWPFLEGRAADGTWLRAPVLLYPVTLGQTRKGRLRWTLAPSGPPLVNEALLQTLARLAGVRVTVDDILAHDADGRFHVDDDTWQAIAETFQVAGLPLHETAPRLPALQPLEPRDREARQSGPTDRFRLAFHLVLGRFPASASTLVLDYDALLAGSLDDESLGLAAAVLGVDEEVAWTPRPDAPPPDSADPADPIGGLRRWQPLMSDASQDAVFRHLERADGAPGLVVQGPPGTGKSQLLTNLVAASVARGDRVLVVCQKRAALDVVADRLSHLGLRDAVALVHDVQHDRNAVCQGVADSLGGLLEEGARPAAELRRTLDRAAADHQRADTRVAARIRASQAAFLLLAGEGAARPGLAELDERALADPGAPLPDLRPWVQDVTEDDLVLRAPDVDALAPEAAPLARPHPLWGRGEWGDLDPAAVDQVFRDLRRLAAALDAFTAARAAGGLLGPHDVDALADTWAESAALLDLVVAADPDDLDAFLLFWGWCGGEREHGPWLELFARLEAARAELEPVPPELVSRPDAQLDADALRFDDLAALDERWYRFFVPRYWKLRGLAKRTVASFAEPPELGEDRPVALAALHRAALPWQDLIAGMPSRNPFFDFGFSGDPAQLDAALAKVLRHRDCVAAVHLLRDRLARFGEPYTELPDLSAAADGPGVLSVGFFSAFAADARKARALQALDAALTDLRPHLHPSFSRFVRDAAMGDPAPAAAALRRFLEARGEVDGAAALDRRLAPAPPWLRAFLRLWRPAPEAPEPASVAARRAVEWAWRQSLLDGRPRSAVEGPLVAAEASRDLAAAVDERRERTSAGILARHHARLLDVVATEPGRQGLARLAADARKRRYRATLRQIIERYWGHGLEILRPVWLASPESVAALFPLQPGLFDLVVFDEASQCPVESGVPTLIRARRAVIAGDDQQMPPSHFFRVGPDDDLDDDEDETTLLASASILDLSRVAFPGTTLRWHYRCRHEPLIAFSNAAFYARRLATAPNAERRARASWEGVRWTRVDGLWVDQTNPVEAEAIVDALDRVLAEEIPEGGGPPSVGIVTFNKKQSELVESLIEARAALDQGFRDRIARDRERPEIDQVFIRNLENVQGDERDVILMSLGYGPTEPGGKVHARFGPLGQEGGEKRLNVAITRARLGLGLFASFEPEALSVGGTKHVGPKLLQTWLRYVRAAAAGDDVQVSACLADALALGGGKGVTAGPGGGVLDARRVGLRVRDAVASALDGRGYRVRAGVGLGRLSLDLAVAGVDDEVFRVGVDTGAFLTETDPLTRDLYVPRFFERLGWTVLRVTPGAWLDERDRVLELIEDAVEAASTA